jgi:hypothetical protein
LILAEHLVIPVGLGISTSSGTPSSGTSGGTLFSVDSGDDGDRADAEEDDDGSVADVMTDTLLHLAVGSVDIEFATAGANSSF